MSLDYSRDDFARIAKAIREHDEKLMFHTSKHSEDKLIEEIREVETEDLGFQMAIDALEQARDLMIQASNLRYQAMRIMEDMAEHGTTDEVELKAYRDTMYEDYLDDERECDVYGTGW